MDFDYYEDLIFPRQSKLASEKHYKGKTTKRHIALSNRNKEQKNKQFVDIVSRKYRNKERNEKRDTTLCNDRKYYCKECSGFYDTPCRCGYTQWCGNDGPFEKCREAERLGIHCTVSYDVLCSYHVIDYNDYLYC